MQYAKELLNKGIQKAQALNIPLPKAIDALQQDSQREQAQITQQDAVARAAGSSVPLAPAPQSPELRIHRFKQELQASHINVEQLKRLAFHGVPDTQNLRATVWKVTFTCIGRAHMLMQMSSVPWLSCMVAPQVDVCMGHAFPAWHRRAIDCAVDC